MGGDGLASQKPKRERAARIALKTFIARCLEAGEKPISEYRPVLEYVEATKLPMEFVEVCFRGGVGVWVGVSEGFCP